MTSMILAALGGFCGGRAVALLWTCVLQKNAAEDKPKLSASKKIAYWVLIMVFVDNLGVLALCGYSIWRGFTGALPYLTAMIGLLEMASGYVLGHYFKKSAKENTAGGIVYETNVRRDM